MKGKIAIAIKTVKLIDTLDSEKNGKTVFTKGKEYKFIDSCEVWDDMDDRHNISPNGAWFKKHFIIKE